LFMWEKRVMVNENKIDSELRGIFSEVL